MTVELLRHGPFADAVRRHRLIVSLRRVTSQSALMDLVDELADAGVRVLEIGFDAATAAADLGTVRARLAARADGTYFVGAGTVLRRHDLEAARRAGVDFAAAPLLDASLVSTAVEEGLPFIPGAFTPTEVATAWAAGATLVKLFPASAAGPTFVRDIRGPMPDAQLIPTGGVDAANVRGFLDAGAVAVGIGGAITTVDADRRRAILDAITDAGGGR